MNDITVIQLKNGQVKKLYFSGVLVRAVSSALQDKTALENNSNISVRIFDEKALAILPGDKVIFGEVGEEIPYNEAFTVTSVRNNIRGSKKTDHVRLILS